MSGMENDVPSRLLRLLGDLELNALSLCGNAKASCQSLLDSGSSGWCRILTQVVDVHYSIGTGARAPMLGLLWWR